MAIGTPPIVASIPASEPTVGISPRTRITICAVAPAQIGVATWVAVIVADPAPTTFALLPVISITFISDEVKVQLEGDVEVGGTSAKSESLITFSKLLHAPTVGTPTTVKTIVRGVDAP